MIRKALLAALIALTPVLLPVPPALAGGTITGVVSTDRVYPAGKPTVVQVEVRKGNVVYKTCVVEVSGPFQERRCSKYHPAFACNTSFGAEVRYIVLSGDGLIDCDRVPEDPNGFNWCTGSQAGIHIYPGNENPWSARATAWVEVIPPTPTPTPPPCGGSWVELVPPGGDFRVIPPWPIVTGQDPERRGVDVEVAAWGGKVRLHWRRPEWVCDDEECHWECTDGIETHEDPLAEVRLSYRLSEESQRWIRESLARRYPGAGVKGRYPVVVLLYKGTGMMSYRGAARRLNVADPGLYELEITLRTTGTPVSRPQVRHLKGLFKVWLLDSTLVR